MTPKEYKEMIRQYSEIGYVPIGNIQKPYFIPKPSERDVENFTKQFIERRNK